MVPMINEMINHFLRIKSIILEMEPENVPSDL
jgi:hypothetical protein